MIRSGFVLFRFGKSGAISGSTSLFGIVRSGSMASKITMEDVEEQQSVWQATLACYGRVLQEKANKKSKTSSRDELLRLDKWYQETLPGLISDRPEKHIKHDELVQLVHWKLSRGKFRPRLAQLAESNPSDEVESISKRAFKTVDKGKSIKSIREAIGFLTKMKGIGPATASAVLSAGCPDQAAFMSDEPAQLALKQSSLKYSLPEYMEYVETVRNVANKLNDADQEFGWTPHKVESTMWAHEVAAQLGMDLSEITAQAISSKKPAKASTSKDTEASGSKSGSKKAGESSKSEKRKAAAADEATETKKQEKKKKKG